MDNKKTENRIIERLNIKNILSGIKTRIDEMIAGLGDENTNNNGSGPSRDD